MNSLQERPEPEYVYLIADAGRQRAKIGRSRNVARRLSTLLAMSPVRLELLWYAPGGATLEAALHRRFRDRQSHGEWFDFSDGLEPAIAVQEAVAEFAHTETKQEQAARKYLTEASSGLPLGSLSTTLDEMAKIEDPIIRGRACTQLIAQTQHKMAEIAIARAHAINKARAAGQTLEQIAAQLGVTPGRVSQMSHACFTRSRVAVREEC